MRRLFATLSYYWGDAPGDDDADQDGPDDNGDDDDDDGPGNGDACTVDAYVAPSPEPPASCGSPKPSNESVEDMKARIAELRPPSLEIQSMQHIVSWGFLSLLHGLIWCLFACEAAVAEEEGLQVCFKCFAELLGCAFRVVGSLTRIILVYPPPFAQHRHLTFRIILVYTPLFAELRHLPFRIILVYPPLFCIT